MSKAAAEDPELQLKPEARAELVDRVQRDWKEREFVETIQLNIMQIVAFLNTFDQSARFKLGDSRAIQSHPPIPDSPAHSPAHSPRKLGGSAPQISWWAQGP